MSCFTVPRHAEGDAPTVFFFREAPHLTRLAATGVAFRGIKVSPNIF